MSHLTWRLFLLSMVASLTLACAPPAPTEIPAKPQATALPQAAAPTQPSAAPTTAKTQAQTATPALKIKRGGVLRNAYRYSIDSLDPQLNTSRQGPAMTLLFDTLLSYRLVDLKSEKFEVSPSLAESYKVVDPTTLEFKLVKGVKFHDGSDFNATVAKWNLDRAANHPTSKVKLTVEPIKDIQIVDDYTLRLILKAPSAVLPLQLTPANPGLVAIISKDAVEKEGEEKFANNPVGTGPMKFKQWVRDDRIVLDKFPNHWEKGEDGQPLPYLDGYIERYVPDSTVALVELKAANVDLNAELDMKDVATVQASPNLRVDEVPISWRMYPGIWINSRPGLPYPMSNNQKLRYAAQYAIDRNSMAQALGFGMARPAYYPQWFPGYVGYDESLPRREFDLAKAKSLMAEAGVANGVDVEVKVINRPADVRPLEVLQSMWAKADIRLKISALDRLPWIDDGRSGKFELLGHGWFQRADPQVIQVLRTGSAEDWGGYSNPEVDKLWEQADREYDTVKRAEIYRQMQRILYEDSFQVTSYMFRVVAGVNNKVKNHNVAFNYRYVWME
ncbi:MAG: ABC transporter substrate-binding protein [Actinobacteria bacterium]|nr:ABC transporter substrate-binding protein [Actinomycetota bacterium]